MGFVFKPIKKVVDKVVDIVEDVVDDVVDVVEDVADWVVDEIIDPVVDMGQDIIKYATDNPLETLAKMAAYATGQVWMIPLIDGAAVAAKGGDLGDIVKAAAISYASGKVSGTVSKFVDPEIAKAGFNSTVSAAISGGTKSATTALIYGQDPLKAFVTGGVNAGVGAFLGEIDTKLSNTIEGNLDASGNPIVSGWENLQDGVKDSITTSLSAELAGGNISANSIGSIVAKYTGVADTMTNFLAENTLLDATQAMQITSALTSAATTALAGDPSMSGEAFFAKFSEYGMEDLKAMADKPVNKAIDKVTGTSEKTQKAATALNEAMSGAATAAEGFNGVREEFNGKIQEQERLKTVYNNAVDAHNANPSDDTANAANIASKDYNEYVTTLTKEYNDTYKPQMDAYQKEYDKWSPMIADLETTYADESKYLMQDIEALETDMKPIYEGVNKTTALALRPGIDEDKYRELNGLEAGDDVYSHYLANQETAQVFDVTELNDELKTYLETLKKDTSNPSEMYGKSYEARTETETKTNVTTGEPYEREVTRFYLRTPDGEVEVDPYLEGGGRGGDPRDFNAGVWTMKDYRTENLGAVSLGGRVTSDMASIIGDSSKQGQLITLNDFKKLKDAGYKVNSFRDKYTGELINGDKSYDDILANYVKEGRSESAKYADRSSTKIDFEGQTEITQQIYEDVVKFFREEQGLSEEEAEIQADQIAPVGGLLLGSYVQEQAGMNINTALQEYMRNAEVTIAGEAFEKYAVGEEPEKYLIAEAARLVGDENYNAFLQNTAGLGLDAIGQLAQTMSYATILTNAAGLTDTKAEETWLNSFGKILSTAGEGLKTEEYQAQITKLNEDMSKAMADTEGVGGTLKAILGVAWENPTAFISEYVVSEIFQELPLLLASGGTSVLIKGGLKVGAKAVGKEFAETALKRIGVGTALTTSVVSNVAEGYGGGAQDGYEKGLNTYNSVEFKNLTAKGLSASEARAVLETPEHIEKAEAYALELAEQAGAIGGAMAILTAGAGAKFGMPDSLALEKALFNGKDMPAGFADYVKDLTFKTAGGEGAAEALEEGVISGFIEGRLALIDPSRDVSGNTAMAAFLGFIGGSNTAGGIKVGNDILTVNSGMSTEAKNIITTAPPNVLKNIGIGSFTGPTMSGDSGASDAFSVPAPEVVIEELTKLGVSSDAKFDLANVVHNDLFTTKAEVKEYVKLNNPEFDFTGGNETNAYSEFVGQRPDADLATLMAAYIDGRGVDIEEVKAAAEAEGITLTDEQAAAYVMDNVDEVEALDTAIKEIENKSLFYTNADGDSVFAGYYPDMGGTEVPVTPTPDDVSEGEFKPGVDGKVPDGITPPPAGSANSAVVVEYVNEITGETYSAPSGGYTPVEGSGWVVKPPASVALPAEPVDDPLTADDVKDIIDTAIGNLPESASPEDVSSAIEDALAGMNNLSDADVTSAIEDALADMNNLSSEDVQDIVDEATGVNAEAISDLETSLTALIEKNNGDVSAALGELATAMGVGEASILEELGTTEANLTEKFEAGISDVEESVSNLETSLTKLIEENNGDVNAALDELADNLETTEADILEELDTTEAELTDKFQTGISDVEESVSNLETNLTALIEKNNGDVNAALDELADNLGTTEANILEELGTTEANLTEKFEAGISDVEGSIGTLSSDLAALGLDVDTIADLIGKPAREVTETDVDFVIDLIAQENVSEELTMQYDVTGDGIVDINDQNMLSDKLQGNDVTLADTSMFNPATGMYAEMDANTDATMDAIADMNTNINTKIDVQDQQQKLRDLVSMEQQGLFKGAKTTVSSADPMNIDYLYDFNSVFANPSQEGLFASPYSTTTRNKAANQSTEPMPMASGFAEGGQVEDENDILLRLLGET